MIWTVKDEGTPFMSDSLKGGQFYLDMAPEEPVELVALDPAQLAKGNFAKGERKEFFRKEIEMLCYAGDYFQVVPGGHVPTKGAADVYILWSLESIKQLHGSLEVCLSLSLSLSLSLFVSVCVCAVRSFFFAFCFCFFRVWEPYECENSVFVCCFVIESASACECFRVVVVEGRSVMTLRLGISRSGDLCACDVLVFCVTCVLRCVACEWNVSSSFCLHRTNSTQLNAGHTTHKKQPHHKHVGHQSGRFPDIES